MKGVLLSVRAEAMKRGLKEKTPRSRISCEISSESGPRVPDSAFNSATLPVAGALSPYFMFTPIFADTTGLENIYLLIGLIVIDDGANRTCAHICVGDNCYREIEDSPMDCASLVSQP